MISIDQATETGSLKSKTLIFLLKDENCQVWGCMVGFPALETGMQEDLKVKILFQTNKKRTH